MIKRLHSKVRPKQGYAHFFHLAIVALLPIAVFALVRSELESVALAVILLSKWRMFAVRPHHWLAHIRTNAVDIIFSLSILAFMSSTSMLLAQIAWVIAYEVWVLYIKPGSSPLFISAQALITQLAGVSALFIAFDAVPIVVYIAGTAAILYYCARHFFGIFDEPNAYIYTWIWTLFGASLAWVLSHWLLFYGDVAQPAVLLAVIGAGVSGLYYLAETEKLSKLILRQIVFVTVAVITVLIVLSDWGSKTI